IFGNTQLGIDLGNAGVTPNQNPPSSQGPNRLQNFPVLTAATVSGSDLTITGTLTAKPKQTYRIEFFVQDAGDPSGFGQGKTFIGFRNVTTDNTGKVIFTATFSGVNIPAGKVITATATDSDDNTSEFSAWIRTT